MNKQQITNNEPQFQQLLVMIGQCLYYQLLHRHCHDEKSRTDGSDLRLPIIPEDFQ